MPKVTIILQPTRRHEELGGVKYRVYEGRTDSGVRLEMLGLFRIGDPMQREEFQRAVCAVEPGDPAPVRLISDRGLIKP